MFPSFQSLVVYATADTPLNHGQDEPVVLILGGAAMLAVSLFLSLGTQRRNPRPRGIRRTNHATPTDPRLASHRPARRTRRGTPRANTPAHKPQSMIYETPSIRGDSRRGWLPAVTRAAEEARLGTPVPLMTPSGRHGVQLTHCQSCLHNHSNSCERERRILERALQSVSPGGEVVEVACTIDRPGSCRFEIIPGGA